MTTLNLLYRLYLVAFFSIKFLTTNKQKKPPLLAGAFLVIKIYHTLFTQATPPRWNNDHHANNNEDCVENYAHKFIHAIKIKIQYL